MIQGIDTSFWCTTILDEKLKKRVYSAHFDKIPLDLYKFCIVKATGCNPAYADPLYTDIAYVQSITDAAPLLPCSVFHWFNPRVGYAYQVQYFISKVCKWEGGSWKYNLPVRPWLDVEVLTGQSYKETANRIDGFLNMFGDITGVLPGIYTRKNIWNYLPKRDWRRFDLWAARYNIVPPELPNGFDHWTFWQYADNGIVPGLLGGVDMNYFNPALDWNAYMGLLGPKVWTVLQDAPMNFSPQFGHRNTPIATGEKFTVLKTELDEYGNKWGCYDEAKQLWVMMEFGATKLVE